MMKINLEEIISKQLGDWSDKELGWIKLAMIDFGEQLLELAAENAQVEVEICMGHKTGDTWVNEESITDTIKQVEI